MTSRATALTGLLNWYASIFVIRQFRTACTYRGGQCLPSLPRKMKNRPAS